MIKYLFLDIDGVLNNCQPNPNGYCGLTDSCVKLFNRFMENNPDIKIILTSSWRYLILTDQMNLRGFENLLLTHGISYNSINNRIISTTDFDSEKFPDRESQIIQWLKSNDEDIFNPPNTIRFAILDDMSLKLPNFVRTEQFVGLQQQDIDKLQEIFDRK